MALTLLSASKHFAGTLSKYSHVSTTTHCTMVFNVFLPKTAVEDKVKVPVLYCLGGLTSTEDNFAQKAGAAQHAANYEIALVFPDTSPRNVDFNAGADESIGYSAGFYLNATQAPWDKNWKMYDYVSKELPQVISENLPIDISRSSITGHSMGGHGALSIFLKNQHAYKSVSAFAPILHLSKSNWGKYALPQYLGNDESTWKQYDVLELLQKHVAENSFRKDVKVLIDQGTGDQFLTNNLHTDALVKLTKEMGLESQFDIRYHDGYDHGYFFISTFTKDHIDHHGKILRGL
ncbi:S-formylglutathione hydrolase [Entomortierella parvispora]|uniref:S-formylglutathione hydrolase n=1 Tax=Entomortierella parvispora TaxID=205924 RepID=A0A9P3LTA1_9FUNG|nr:S-formylglutathione hydrolase [Entomortierella parvispora]